jgi:hypothetical protein
VPASLGSVTNCVVRGSFDAQPLKATIMTVIIRITKTGIVPIFVYVPP